LVSCKRDSPTSSNSHQLSAYDDERPWPKPARTLRGINRQHPTPKRQAAALTTPEIKKLLATCDSGLTGLRDRALILIGYAGALRRSEIVAIEREHLTFGTDGVRLLIPQSKTDGEGQWARVGIPLQFPLALL
jgi:integrase